MTPSWACSKSTDCRCAYGLEWRVLSCLALRKENVLQRADLLERVYEGDADVDSNSVEVIITGVPPPQAGRSAHRDRARVGLSPDGGQAMKGLPVSARAAAACRRAADLRCTAGHGGVDLCDSGPLHAPPDRSAARRPDFGAARGAGGRCRAFEELSRAVWMRVRPSIDLCRAGTGRSCQAIGSCVPPPWRAAPWKSGPPRPRHPRHSPPLHRRPVHLTVRRPRPETVPDQTARCCISAVSLFLSDRTL